ncbi:anti-sigma-E factor ChrR [Cellvibrio zantedeschiae]|uniref:Anti-sigma-E factor ChrR n=1 Tax=Cellvibrio zantedeschiae TaxID=1237077 RepID=A0ABQ3B2S6_9GAMM|nr:ChrR family anti-sigma-E factor [Cellvibrio zantedeschiae]GGY75400.1 anti-sigma-E factor ChrR [Cellvibrio zantedeschiae]
MINHHPDDNLLTEYASGSLAIALSLIVCAHLQVCPHCRKRVEHLNKLGASILTHSVAEAVQPDSFAQLMTRIRGQESGVDQHVKEVKVQQQELHSSYAHDPLFKSIPKVIAKLLPRDGKLKWERVSKGLKFARLVTGQKIYEVAFQRITSGNKVVEHDHRGLEVTMVLCGSFSDEDGVYSEGDFLVRTPGEIHRPTATQNQDCLCISVVEAPVKVTGFLGRLINPFLGFKPA